MLWRKRYYKTPDQLADYACDEIGEPDPEGNMVGSLTNDDYHHMPALDLDIPHKYVPSSTPGHGHLYIDVPMVWNDYLKLLHLLAELGILEENFVLQAQQRGMTQLRAPGNYKANADREEDLPF